ncbi:hypothetical protein POM88_048820 [Heracleum sosnowskyi]|uniref:Glycosyltransferases n=1 Tax=Heracleum sosnowskyi TaxID=360622 RepID=A0AAD8M0U7_9APIA|nr:hypothetical protein POM88_048820 [Heracleum sosnowskyi]
MFADDSNMHSMELFDEIQTVKGIRAVSVGILAHGGDSDEELNVVQKTVGNNESRLPIQGPACNTSEQLAGWHTFDSLSYARNSAKFIGDKAVVLPTKMEWAGFVLNSILLWEETKDKPEWVKDLPSVVSYMARMSKPYKYYRDLEDPEPEPFTLSSPDGTWFDTCDMFHPRSSRVSSKFYFRDLSRVFETRSSECRYVYNKRQLDLVFAKQPNISSTSNVTRDDLYEEVKAFFCFDDVYDWRLPHPNERGGDWEYMPRFQLAVQSSHPVPDVRGPLKRSIINFCHNFTPSLERHHFLKNVNLFAWGLLYRLNPRYESMAIQNDLLYQRIMSMGGMSEKKKRRVTKDSHVYDSGGASANLQIPSEFLYMNLIRE